jgi:hypothetical protein
MKFIEVAEGFSIRIDSIVSIKTTEEENILQIETEDRDYKIKANFRMLMDELEKEEMQKREMDKLTTQFFGG